MFIIYAEHFGSYPLIYLSDLTYDETWKAIKAKGYTGNEVNIFKVSCFGRAKNLSIPHDAYHDAVLRCVDE